MTVALKTPPIAQLTPAIRRFWIDVLPKVAAFTPETREWRAECSLSTFADAAKLSRGTVSNYLRATINAGLGERLPDRTLTFDASLCAPKLSTVVEPGAIGSVGGGVVATLTALTNTLAEALENRDPEAAGLARAIQTLAKAASIPEQSDSRETARPRAQLVQNPSNLAQSSRTLKDHLDPEKKSSSTLLNKQLREAVAQTRSEDQFMKLVEPLSELIADTNKATPSMLTPLRSPGPIMDALAVYTDAEVAAAVQGIANQTRIEQRITSPFGVLRSQALNQTEWFSNSKPQVQEQQPPERTASGLTVGEQWVADGMVLINGEWIESAPEPK